MPGWGAATCCHCSQLRWPGAARGLQPQFFQGQIGLKPLPVKRKQLLKKEHYWALEGWCWGRCWALAGSPKMRSKPQLKA